MGVIQHLDNTGLGQVKEALRITSGVSNSILGNAEPGMF